MSLMLLKYWKGLVIVILLVIIGILVYFIKDYQFKLAKSDSYSRQCTIALDYQNNQLENNYAKYLRDLADANKSNEIVRTKFKTIYKNIETFKGDSNGTDCSNTIKFFSRMVY